MAINNKVPTKNLDYLFQAYRSVVLLSSKYPGLDLKPPELYIIGEQSSGKSTLLEYYIQFPCNFVDPDTGTRCPIRFVLHQDDGDGTTCTITSKNRSTTCNKDELSEKIRDHMYQLSLGEKFSSEPLTVEVFGAALDAVLVDLPGMVNHAILDEKEVVIPPYYILLVNRQLSR